MADPDHQHIPAEKERALRALVLADGKPSKARQALAADGQEVPLRTIQQWRNDYAARYDWLEKNQRKWVSREIAKRSRRAGQLFGSGALKIARTIDSLTDEEISEISVGVRANAVKALESAQAIAFTQADQLDKTASDHVEESEEDMATVMRGFARFFAENKLKAEVPAELSVPVEGSDDD